MSTWDDKQITCVFCSEMFTVKVASGLHISRLPAVREQIARGELHRFNCPRCQGTIEVRLPMIYTDFERGHWIEIRPADEISAWRERSVACAVTFERAINQGSPLLRERSPTFRVRLVFGYDELREKVTLWDAGLDDVAVECLKLAAVRSNVSILGVDDRLITRAIDGDRMIIDRRRGETAAEAFSLPWSAAALDRAKLAAAHLLEALDGPFVSINRVVGRYSLTDPV